MNLDSPSVVPRVMAQPTGSSSRSSRVSPAMTRLDERLVVVVGHDREGAAVGGDELRSPALRARRGACGRGRAGLRQVRGLVVRAVRGLGEVGQEAPEHRMLGAGRVGQRFVPGAQLLCQHFGRAGCCLARGAARYGGCSRWGRVAFRSAHGFRILPLMVFRQPH